MNEYAERLERLDERLKKALKEAEHLTQKVEDLHARSEAAIQLSVEVQKKYGRPKQPKC